MTAETPYLPYIRDAIDKYLDNIKEDLWDLNKQVHDNPEIAFQEHKAHDAIAKLLENQGCDVTRHAYGIETALESLSGNEGRVVNLNAEFDALPGLGHACGHNLICISSVAGYLALSHILKNFGIKGRLKFLGTPAEEAGGGKLRLLDAGAYKDVDASIMAHPTTELTYQDSIVGVSGQSTLAMANFIVTFTGRSAHAAANPWDGVNALDAVVASYNNVSLLRQQIHPDQRIHSCILEAPKIPNAVPEQTKTMYTIRSAVLANQAPLVEKVRHCIEAGAAATGCAVHIEKDMDYASVKVNVPLAQAFAEAVDHWGVKLQVTNDEPIPASTDMGDVSQVVPGLHAIVGIYAQPGDFPHNRGFERAAGMREGFERFLIVAKGLAITGLKVLTDDEFAEEMKKDFEGRGNRATAKL